MPVAPAAGQVAELPISVGLFDGPAFHIVSVHYVGPRPRVVGPGTSFFNWTRRNTIFKPVFPANAPYQQRHEVIIQNPNTVAITVACRAYRLAEQ